MRGARAFFRYVGGSRRELSGVKELVTSRRVQKRPSANIVRSDGGCIGGSPGSGGVIAGGLLGGCSGGNDALAELTIEDLASLPAGNHTSANHTGHSSHHKVSELCLIDILTTTCRALNALRVLVTEIELCGEVRVGLYVC